MAVFYCFIWNETAFVLSYTKPWFNHRINQHSFILWFNTLIHFLYTHYTVIKEIVNSIF